MDIRKNYLICSKKADIVLEHDGALNPIETKKISTLVRRAIVCMKPGFCVIDRDNYIVSLWMI